ncbi:MAG: family 20 glycosylhydrolase [Actinobacteria bacterium]|nr:family 20 glycosylhydrolase [Actinomycetota bacterium]
MVRRLLTFLFVIAFCYSTKAETQFWGQSIALIPYPQQATLTTKDFIFDEAFKLDLDEGATPTDSFAAGDLAERLETEWGVAFSSGDNVAGKRIVLTRRNAAPRIGDQGYELFVNRDSIVIRAKGEAGLFWGTRTLLQLVQQRDSFPFVKGIHIVDWPDIPVRAVHYDTKHHQDKKAYVQAFIRTLADYKINMLIWEWEDKFAYKSHPEIGAPGAFTMQEMQEFTRYAQRFHIQIVPLVQGLGHVSYILKWPQNAHLREIAASNWEFCPRKEGTYDLLFDLFDEAVQATPGSQYLHIGTDETFELGLGVACGCKARAQQVGRYGLMLDFIDRCDGHLRAQGRKIISWGGEYRADEKRKPPQGLIVSEFTGDLEIARSSREAGYPAWVYDPNPGIEHLFLPYLYRIRDGAVTDGCLQSSFNRLSSAAQSGLFDGMVCTSWDDSGLHNQVWMMRFINAAEYSWSGARPSLPEFQQKYFVKYYGRNARDVAELWRLLNDGAYYYMDTFERKVWHWGYIGKTHLPDLPRGDAVGYDPFWNREYSDMSYLIYDEQVLDLEGYLGKLRGYTAWFQREIIGKNNPGHQFNEQ